MRIYGDNSSSFTTYAQEPGLLFGKNDILLGQEQFHTITQKKVFSSKTKNEVIRPILYLHIKRSNFSKLTGALRNTFLPWRWKSIYLQPSDTEPLLKALVCTSVKNGPLPSQIKTLCGKTLLETTLRDHSLYRSKRFHEYVALKKPVCTTINSVLKTQEMIYCRIYRRRSLISHLGYVLRNNFGHKWTEVTTVVKGVYEKILIRNKHVGIFDNLSLIGVQVIN
ncbi:MAG: hypothetical protein JHC93_03790 [Parachlamydiales bacterium]|nr:hypothetical protein [Parachlamydiales bacterium]